MQSNITVYAGPAARPGIDRPTQPIAAAARFPRGLRFEGEGAFECDVAIDGEVSGSLRLDGQAMLLVSPTGRADGSFRAGHARIEGQVNGEIDCSTGAVDFADTAHCKVKVLYSELSVARGADIEADLQRVTEKVHG